MPARLLVILDEPRTGAFNMAADRYLLGRCEDSDTVWLRFYTWQPPCVSLGYMQDPRATLDAGALSRGGIDWIRRLTGGRAVLHWDDITYSCVFSVHSARMGRSIAESYGVIARSLIAGLRRLGVRADASTSRLESGEARRHVKLPCFLAPNRDEIMVNGRKLIGSAQKRTVRGVLQHGSIPIAPAFRRLPEFLAVDDEHRHAWGNLLDEKTTCLEECGVRLGMPEIAARLVEGFEQVLGAPRTVHSWTKEEAREIGEISGRGAQGLRSGAAVL